MGSIIRRHFFTKAWSRLYSLHQGQILYSTMHTAKFVNDNITVSNDSDVKLTLYNEKDTDDPLTLLCPGETKKRFTGRIVTIEPYQTYSTRSWQLSEDMEFDADKEVTVTDQSEQFITIK